MSIRELDASFRPTETVTVDGQQLSVPDIIVPPNFKPRDLKRQEFWDSYGDRTQYHYDDTHSSLETAHELWAVAADKIQVGKKRGLYLDIGSGDGVLTAEILLRNPDIRVVCGDISRNFLEQTRDRLAQIPEARGRYALYQMDAGQQFPFEDGKFVGSLAHFVATYFDREEQMMLYKEVVRVSEDGAVFTMNTLLKPFKEVVGGMIRKEAPTNPKGVQRFMKNVPIAQQFDRFYAEGVWFRPENFDQLQQMHLASGFRSSRVIHEFSSPEDGLFAIITTSTT